MAHIPFLLFSFSHLRQFVASKLQLYTPDGINLFNCQFNLFWLPYSFYNSCFLKKDCSCKDTIRLRDGDLEHSLMTEKNMFLCSDIPDLALGILKMLIPFCFCGVLQPAV